MKYIVIDGRGKKVSKEEAAEDDPECWWSLKELKKLWPGKLTSGGPTEEG